MVAAAVAAAAAGGERRDRPAARSLESWCLDRNHQERARGSEQAVMTALWRPPHRRHSPGQREQNRALLMCAPSKPPRTGKGSPTRNLGNRRRQTLNDENKAV